MMKKALLLLLSSLLMYGESLRIDIRQFTQNARAAATLFKTDEVSGTVTIKSEEDLKKIFRKEEARYVPHYIGRIIFKDISPGNYHLDINVWGGELCGDRETFLYAEDITVSPGESPNLEFILTTHFKKGIYNPTLIYNHIVDGLKERKTILNETVDLNPGESYTKKMNIGGKEIGIQINAPYYSRNESASITRGDRLGSNGMYLVRNDPSLEIYLDVDSRNVSSSPCYFDEYGEIKSWQYCYSDIFIYAGGRIDLAIDPFILEYYPVLTAKTGMNTKGLLKNHFYFEGIKVGGVLQLYQIENKTVKVKKGTSGRIEVIE